MLFAVDDVLTKAIGRFSLHGYHATSIGDLEDCMGIRRASSKRGLFVRALRFYIESYDRSLQELLDQSSTPAGAIIGVFKEAAANGCFNAGIEMAPHDAEITRIVTGEIAASRDPRLAPLATRAATTPHKKPTARAVSGGLPPDTVRRSVARASASIGRLRQYLHPLRAGNSAAGLVSTSSSVVPAHPEISYENERGRIYRSPQGEA